MSITAKLFLFLLVVVAAGVLCNRLFRFTDQDDLDDGEWE